MASQKRPVLLNRGSRDIINGSSNRHRPAEAESQALDRFHGSFPGGGPTNLVRLDGVASALGLKAVYVKDESTRFSLPSFKILGASWGTFRAVAGRLGVPFEKADLASLKDGLTREPVTLYAASEGNHGRAVAHMARLLGVGSEIHVPATMHAATIANIEGEGAHVVVNKGTYDDAMDTAKEQAERKDGNGLLVQDYSFDGHTEVPQWIVDGYATMLREVDEQIGETPATHVFSPVGVGSLAQAAVTHYKNPGRQTTTSVVTVEADSAACLYKSLAAGKLVKIQTYDTIMRGLNCETVSPIAWPTLRCGVDASVTVSDYEAYKSVEYLETQGLSAGPCGAAPLAALQRLTPRDMADLGLDSSSVVVMICSEGAREYKTPRSVSIDDAPGLTQALVQIDSSSPSLGSVPGPGETAVARYIAEWLEHRNVETHWIESTTGRPSVVGVVRGSGGGKSLMLNGHIDTVTTLGMDHDPLSGVERDGKIYGRGAADMKAGVAAAMVALVKSREYNLRGDVIFTGVADEEATSIGTADILNAGWRADGAVVSEPSGETIINMHKGFVWLEVDIHGLAAHGSRPSQGIDAIVLAGHFLVELGRYADKLQSGWNGDPLMAPSVHASTIKGGEEPSSYPALCTIVLERRTIAGETRDSVQREIQQILDNLAASVKDFKYDLRVTFDRPSHSVDLDDPFAVLLGETANEAIGRKVEFGQDPAWTDCALLAAKGITALQLGPIGHGIHAKEECVEVASIERVTKALELTAKKFCS